MINVQLSSIQRRYRASAGSALILVVVAVAVTAIYMMVGSRMVASGIQVHTESLRRHELDALRRYVVGNVDCVGTNEALDSPCMDGQEVELKSILERAGTSALVAIPESRIGNYRLRAMCATCQECGGETFVKVQFLRDGLDALRQRFRGWQDLFSDSDGMGIDCSLSL